MSCFAKGTVGQVIKFGLIKQILEQIMILSIEYGIRRKKFPFECSERMACYRIFRVNSTSGILNLSAHFKSQQLR